VRGAARRPACDLCGEEVWAEVELPGGGIVRLCRRHYAALLRSLERRAEEAGSAGLEDVAAQLRRGVTR